MRGTSEMETLQRILVECPILSLEKEKPTIKVYVRVGSLYLEERIGKEARRCDRNKPKKLVLAVLESLRFGDTIAIAIAALRKTRSRVAVLRIRSP